MPEASPPVKFIQSLRTRKTDVMKKLDNMFSNPAAFQNHPRFAQNAGDNLQAARILDTLKPWAAQVLQAGPLAIGAAEIAHIDAWPADQKERVRDTLVTAISADRRVHFFWELHGGDDEVTDILDDGEGDITIIFRSPTKNVDINAAGTNVSVRVGSAGGGKAGP
jgi:hypothetical protein